jgi:hypothetical protein
MHWNIHRAHKALINIARLFGFAFASLAILGATPAQAADNIIRQIPSSGFANLINSNPGADGLQAPEFDTDLDIADGPTVNARSANASAARMPGMTDRTGRMVNRSFARNKGVAEAHGGSAREDFKQDLALSFDGLNLRQQRLANNGNQFTIEPPDQALCVGNGYVLESVNTVLRVFDTAGNALTSPIDLNSFYGYIPAIVRSTSTFGPNITDPICYFDTDTQRWFHVVLTIDRVGTTSARSGKNHLDIAVSTTASPLGAWKIYRIPVQNDGTDGTPKNPACPCLGDYPHIGADANGIYLTTNEFPFSGGFNSAQIYAISKKALARGDNNINVVQIDTANYLLEGNPGFTVWPAISPAGRYERAKGGTEYFLSSLAVFNDNNTDNRLRIWALNNTRSLNSATPNVRLTHSTVNVATYGVPPPSAQKPGNIPLAECINDTTLATAGGPGCWRNLFAAEPPHDAKLSPLDSNDSRMQQVYFADGKLYGALASVVSVAGKDQAGSAYYIIEPEMEDRGVRGKLENQGKIALANNNVINPAIAALSNGKAVLSFTLVGADYHPSAGYVTFDDGKPSPIKIAAAGAGPQDGFTGYAALTSNPPRPRWGDYGAAASDGNAIWLATEYIGQTCTLAEYVTVPLGSCGGTRVTLGNWGTRISKITP